MQSEAASTFLERWLTASGPARLALLTPLRDELLTPAEVPSGVELVMEPLRWLIERSATQGIPRTKKGFMRRDFATRWNRELGFESPAKTQAGKTYLEIEALHTIAFASGAIEIVGSESHASAHAHRVLEDPELLWYVAATTLLQIPPPGVVRRIWEVMLGWLLQSNLEPRAMTEALREVVELHGSRHEKHHFEETVQVGIYSLYTYCRALCMFTPARPDQDRPEFSDCGRTTALEALRTACHLTLLK